MKEIKITTVRLNARNELSFKCIVKEEDYTKGDLELIKQADINGNLLDMEFTGLVSGDIQKKEISNLATLNGVMSVYCDKGNFDMGIEIDKLYKRYKVTTRKDIKPSDVESEIESYKMGILEYN